MADQPTPPNELVARLREDAAWLPENGLGNSTGPVPAAMIRQSLETAASLIESLYDENNIAWNKCDEYDLRARHAEAKLAAVPRQMEEAWRAGRKYGGLNPIRNYGDSEAIQADLAAILNADKGDDQ